MAHCIYKNTIFLSKIWYQIIFGDGYFLEVKVYYVLNEDCLCSVSLPFGAVGLSVCHFLATYSTDFLVNNEPKLMTF